MEVDTLIELLILGKREGHNELHSQYFDFIFRHARFIVKNREDAEEVANDAFLKIKDNAGDFEKGSLFTTWMYEIVKNTALEFLEKKNAKKRKTYDQTLAGNEPLHKTEEADLNHPENVLIDQENYSAFLAAIKKLPVKQGIVYTFKMIDDLTNPEIMKEMGNITEASVKSYLFKAKKTMEETFGVVKKRKKK